MSEHGAIKVALGRFDDLLSRGLRGVVEDDPGLELVAAGLGAAQIDAALEQTGARVVILDASSLTSPVEVRGLAARHPQARLIVLADDPSSVETAQLLAFGAAACVAKSTQARDVCNAIHLTSRGLQLTSTGAPRRAHDWPALTLRESDVLAELQRRRSNAQIAADLNISVETVRTHARHIYRKLGVSSRRELLAPSASR